MVLNKTPVINNDVPDNEVWINPSAVSDIEGFEAGDTVYVMSIAGIMNDYVGVTLNHKTYIPTNEINMNSALFRKMRIDASGDAVLVFRNKRDADMY